MFLKHSNGIISSFFFIFGKSAQQVVFAQALMAGAVELYMAALTLNLVTR